jgi:alpha/beta hydrolase fold
MGVVPKAKAGVGSAVNDATRLLGGTLGVAVIGSVFTSLYASRLASTLPAGLPTPFDRTAHSSVGGALNVADIFAHSAHPALASAVHSAASSAFFNGFHAADWVAGGVAAAGALMALALLPAQPTASSSDPKPAALPSPALAPQPDDGTPYAATQDWNQPRPRTGSAYLAERIGAKEHHRKGTLNVTTIPLSHKERTVQTPNGDVFLREIPGQDPPIVLLHGFPDDHRIYNNLLPRLSPRRAIAFDYVGYGHSERPRRPAFSAEDHGHEISAVLDQLAIPRAVLVGHDASGPDAVI